LLLGSPINNTNYQSNQVTHHKGASNIQLEALGYDIRMLNEFTQATQ
jgi:hypothetical protein